MKAKRYPVIKEECHLVYKFLSKGPKGIIRKRIVFYELERGIYNLAFGDWDEIKQRLDDSTRTNNGDRDKVLATVAFAVVDFLNHYPEAIIFAEGVTPGKTRLYQMGINQHWREIKELFYIEGFRKGTWFEFRYGENYEAFTIQKKVKS